MKYFRFILESNQTCHVVYKIPIILYWEGNRVWKLILLQLLERIGIPLLKSEA